MTVPLPYMTLLSARDAHAKAQASLREMNDACTNAAKEMSDEDWRAMDATRKLYAHVARICEHDLVQAERTALAHKAEFGGLYEQRWKEPR